MSSNHLSIQFFQGSFKYRSAIMGVAMLSIILFHQYYVNTLPFRVFHQIGYWGVEIFLFLSGMGMVNSLQKHPLHTAFKRRIKRILPSCIVIGTIKYISYLSIGAPTILGKSLHIGWWSMLSLDMCFVYALLAYYLLSPFLFKLIINYPKASILIVGGIHLVTVCLWKEQIGHTWFNPLGVFVWVIDRLPVFCMGMYLTIYQEKVQKNMMAVSFIFLILCICCCVNDDAKHFSITFISLFLTIATPAMIWLCILLLRKTFSPILTMLSFTGIYSLEIYLIHEYVIHTLGTFYQDVCNNVLLLLIVIALSHVAAYIFRLLIYRTPKLMRKRLTACQFFTP